MEGIKFTKEDADLFLDTCATCMMEGDNDIWYLAAVQKILGSEEYLIEVGYLKGPDEIKHFVSINDISLYCPLSFSIDKNISKTRGSWEKIDGWQTENRQIPISSKITGKIKHSSLKKLKIRPLIAGSAINSIHTPGYAGTLGAFVTLCLEDDDENIECKDDQGGDIYFITNYHNVIHPNLSKVKNLIFQPPFSSFEYENFIGLFDDTDPSLSQYYEKSDLNNFTLDFALIPINRQQISGKLNRITDDEVGTYFIPQSISPGHLSNDICKKERPTIKDLCDPSIGDKVHFFGATTVQSTHEEIISINALVKIQNEYYLEIDKSSTTTNGILNLPIEKDNPIFFNKTLLFRNQILLKNFSESGDSGSVLIDKDDNAIGLITAADDKHTITVANNLNQIFTKTDINDGNTRIKIKEFLT